MIFSTGPKWDGTIDEKAYNPAAAPWFHPNEEAVFGFKDGDAAVFDEFGIYVPEAEDHNVKEVELLAGDDGPAGTFHSIAVITTLNGRFRDGWQEFKFPTTSARFFKVKFVSAHNGGNNINQSKLRLFGQLK